MLLNMKANSGYKKGLFVLLAAAMILSTMAIDMTTAHADTKGHNIAVGHYPQTVAVNPITNKVYVVSPSSDTVTVIDGRDGSTQTISTGDSPGLVAVNTVTNKIYVGNFEGDSVTVIDGNDNSTQTIAAGDGPIGLAVNPVTNKIYVANEYSDNVTVIDGSDNSTQTIATGASPRAMAVDTVTNKVYVANYWSDNVTIIDGSDNSTQTISAGDAPMGVAVNPVTNKVYVSNRDSNRVMVIDGSDNSTQMIAVGAEPGTIAVNPITNKVYVSNGVSDNVTVIDGSDNSTQTIAAGDDPGGVTINPVTNKVYVTNYWSNNVTVIDGNDNSTQTIAVGNAPNAAAINPLTNKVYVVNYASDNVTVIDGSDNKTDTIAAGDNPGAVAINPVTNKVYFANGSSDDVTVIDGSDNSTQTIPVGDWPYALAVNPVTNKVYVANLNSDNVTIIDGSDNSTQTIAVGDVPSSVAVNPETNKVYVTNRQSKNVTVIDGSDNSTQTIATGVAPEVVAVNPVTNIVYVVNQHNDNVTIIDGSDNSTQTVAVGDTPDAIAVNTTTNKVYVTNMIDYNVTIIDGSDNSTQTIGTGGSFPRAVAVNQATNKAYVTVNNSVTVIDGSDNSKQSIATDVGAIPVAVNPVTNTVYIGSSTSDSITIIKEVDEEPSALTVSVDPLPSNATDSVSPTFDFTASSGYSPTAPDVQQIYYQIDTCIGDWQKAEMSGSSASATLSSLTKGTHVLYAFATDGMDATSINTRNAMGPIIGSIEAYAFTIVDTPIVTTSSIPDGIVQDDYSVDIDATAGVEPYSWSATGLPDGLSIEADTGEISGKPEEGGTFTPHVTIIDNTGAGSSKTFSMEIEAMNDGSGALAISPVSVDPGSKDNDIVFTYTPTTSGMYMGEITLQIPAGFTLPNTTSGSDGYVTSTAGTVSVSGQTITVSDIVLAHGDTIDITYNDASVPVNSGTYTLLCRHKTLASGTLTLLNPQPQISVTTDDSAILKINTNTIVDGTAGESYSAAIAASGGETPYSWSAAGLPDGLEMDASTGEISGKPLKAGTYELSLVVKDAQGDKAYKDLTLTVAEQVLAGKYTLTPENDAAYTVSYTSQGTAVLTMNSAASGFRFFTVKVTPVITNEGEEVIVFTLTRDGVQIRFSFFEADFDLVPSAGGGFNVQSGDIIKIYIADELSNASGSNPVLLQ